MAVCFEDVGSGGKGLLWEQERLERFPGKALAILS